MNLLQLTLPLWRFQWFRRRLGGEWEKRKHWKIGHVGQITEWIWLSDERVLAMGFELDTYRTGDMVLDVEDYRITRIDVSHVPDAA